MSGKPILASYPKTDRPVAERLSPPALQFPGTASRVAAERFLPWVLLKPGDGAGAGAGDRR